MDATEMAQFDAPRVVVTSLERLFPQFGFFELTLDFNSGKRG